MKLLLIDSSARAGSVTRQLTAKFARVRKTNHPSAGLHTSRHLDDNPAAHHGRLERNTRRSFCAKPIAAKLPGHIGRINRGSIGSRHHRDRCAHVQLCDPLIAQGLDRPDCPRREDGCLWVTRAPGSCSGFKKVVVITPRAEAPMKRGRFARELRFSRTLFAPHFRICGSHGCDVYPCREPATATEVVRH